MIPAITEIRRDFLTSDIPRDTPVRVAQAVTRSWG
jgi:hypothetical protein